MVKKIPSVLALLISVFLFLSNSSNPPNGYTGAPPTGNSCSASSNGCHTPNNTSSAGNISIAGLPSTIMQNAIYPITVNVNRTNVVPSKAGFQLVVLNAGNSNVDTLYGPGSNSVIQSAGGKKYFEHNPAQAFGGNNTISYTVNWKAPATGSGLITMYAAGNLANGNGANSGDLIVTTSVSGTLTAPPSCNPPGGLAATPDAGGALSAVLNWNVAPAATSYMVNVVRGAGNTTPFNQILSATGNSITVNTFPGPGKYKFRVQSVCAGGVLSAWTTYTSFNVGACGIAAGLTANPTGPTSAQLDWNGILGASSYMVNVRNAPGNPNSHNTTQVAFTNSVIANELPGPGNFRFRVRSICNGLNGAWSAYQNFTLPVVSFQGGNGARAGVGLFPNPASGGEVQLALQDFSGKNEDLHIRVLDLSMRPLKEVFLEKWQGENYRMDVSEMEPGIYFIQVKTGKESMVKRLVVF